MAHCLGWHTPTIGVMAFRVQFSRDLLNQSLVQSRYLLTNVFSVYRAGRLPDLVTIHALFVQKDHLDRSHLRQAAHHVQRTLLRTTGWPKVCYIENLG